MIYSKKKNTRKGYDVTILTFHFSYNAVGSKWANKKCLRGRHFMKNALQLRAALSSAGIYSCLPVEPQPWIKYKEYSIFLDSYCVRCLATRKSQRLVVIFLISQTSFTCVCNASNCKPCAMSTRPMEFTPVHYPEHLVLRHRIGTETSTPLCHIGRHKCLNYLTTKVQRLWVLLINNVPFTCRL